MALHSSQPGRAFVVSIHDVHPGTQETIEQILAQLLADGVRSCSLLVVPDFHKTAPMHQHPQFIDWLQRQAASGHEIVLHGYAHLRSRRKRESPLTRWITQTYTTGEGEFYDISFESAIRKITHGLGMLRDAGVSPSGFIAPAWLLSTAAQEALRSVGMLYTTTLRTVVHLPTQSKAVSQSLVYSVRNAWRRQVSLAWNASLFRREKNNPLLRMGIHPVDFRHEAIWNQIRQLTQAAARDRVSMTYRGWVQDHFRQ